MIDLKSFCFGESSIMEKIIQQVKNSLLEVLDKANLEKGSIFVVGCSSSEIAGGTIGKNSSAEIGEAVFSTINSILSEKGIFLAAQCCEHLNRALVIESDAAKNFDIVCAVPKIKAGGSFATAAYKGFKNPVLIETVSADAGIDIGLTMIGMHIKRVAVPIHLTNNKIGDALVVGAYSRPKYIGGERAEYKQ